MKENNPASPLHSACCRWVVFLMHGLGKLIGPRPEPGMAGGRGCCGTVLHFRCRTDGLGRELIEAWGGLALMPSDRRGPGDAAALTWSSAV